jgi:putative transposase
MATPFPSASSGQVWEHAVRDDADYARHLDYVHYNPVKHGHVSAVAQWPHSTFHRWVKAGVYPYDWGGGDIAEVDAGERVNRKL